MFLNGLLSLFMSLKLMRLMVPCFGGLWTTWGICLIDYEVAKLSGVICAMVNRVDENSLSWRFHISNLVLGLIIFIILF